MQVGDLVKVFPATAWYERCRQSDKEKAKVPFDVGMFLDDYYMEPDDEERMGETMVIVLINGVRDHLSSRNVEAFNGSR